MSQRPWCPGYALIAFAMLLLAASNAVARGGSGGGRGGAHGGSHGVAHSGSHGVAHSGNHGIAHNGSRARGISHTGSIAGIGFHASSSSLGSFSLGSSSEILQNRSLSGVQSESRTVQRNEEVREALSSRTVNGNTGINGRTTEINETSRSNTQSVADQDNNRDGGFLNNRLAFNNLALGVAGASGNVFSGVGFGNGGRNTLGNGRSGYRLSNFPGNGNGAYGNVTSSATAEGAVDR